MDARRRRVAARVRKGQASTTIGLGNQAGFPAEHDERLWIPTRTDRTVVAVDPLTMTVEHTLHLDAEPNGAIAGAGSVWVLTENPSQIHRIDPVKGVFLGPPVVVPTGASVLEFGAGSLWVDDPNTKSLVRLAPTVPSPTARPVRAAAGVLLNGPIPRNVRLRVTEVEPRFSIRVTDDSWLAQALIGSGNAAQFELYRYRRFGPDAVGVGVAVTSQAFDTTGRLTPTRTPEEFLQALRKNPSIRIESVGPATLGCGPASKCGSRRFRSRHSPSSVEGIPASSCSPRREAPSSFSRAPRSSPS